MTKDDRQETEDVGERAGISEAEHQERLAMLVLRRSKLSPDEAALLREIFEDIVAVHDALVWSLLRKHGLKGHDADDLYQEVFLALYNQLLEEGFQDSLPRMLAGLTIGKARNHVRAQKRAPFSIGVPSSSSEKPRSQLDVERALHFQQVARRIFPQLSPEHQEVLDKLVVKGLPYADTAAELGIPEGTLRSRLLAAKRALLALAEPLLPPSQRGPV